MPYNYFTQYQGQRVAPLPQGYMEAATAPGRNLAAGIAGLGEGIGRSIANYRQNKAEDEYATSRLESYFGGQPDKALELAGIVGPKLMKKFEEGKASRADKLAMLNTLDTYSDRRIKEAQAMQADQMIKLGDAMSRYVAPTAEVTETVPAVVRQFGVEEALRMDPQSLTPEQRAALDRYSKEIAAYRQAAGEQGPVMPKPMLSAPPPQSTQAPAEIDWNYGLRQQQSQQDVYRQFDPTSRVAPPSLTNQLQANLQNQPTTAPAQAPVQAPPEKPMFTQTVTPESQVTRQVPLPPQEERSAFVDYLVKRGITDPGVIRQGLAARDIGKGPEVMDLGNGLGGLFVDGQFRDIIKPPGMSESDLKVRTMTINTPPVGSVGQIQGVAPSAEEAVKFRESYAGVSKMVGSLDELLTYAKDGKVFSPADRRKVDTLLGNVIGASRLPILGPGVMTDSEREWLGQLIGNPNRMMQFKDSVVASLEKFKTNALTGLQRDAVALGLKVGGAGAPNQGQPERIPVNVEDLKGY